jgi:argonaute-like protein implicated in RNA metabolism and viral defense
MYSKSAVKINSNLTRRGDLKMDSKDMISEVVYEIKDGLFPLEIAEAVEKRFNTRMTTLEVERIIKKNPKLFVEMDGKIKSPSPAGEKRSKPIDSKDMIVGVVYEIKDGLFPLEIAEAIEKRFNTRMTTLEVERIIKKNPKFFVEIDGRIKNPLHD